MNANLLQLFRDRCVNSMTERFLTLPDGGGFSFGKLFQLAGQMAMDFEERGIRPGDRIVVQVDKSSAAIALYLACLQSGAVFVPLNVAYQAGEVEYFLVDADASLFICRPNAREELGRVIDALGIATLCLGDTREEHWWALVSRCEPRFDIVARTGDDVAAIIYTSGTTGRSKGAMLTHGNLAANALTLHRLWNFGPDDVLLHILPIFHVHGLFVALHCALLSASEVIFLPHFNVDDVRRQLPHSTVLMGVPTHYTRLLACDAFNADDCHNMRLFISGSAPLTEVAFKHFEHRTGHRILERYGMSECGIITSNPLNDERVAGTVGYRLPGVVLRVAGADDCPLATGEVGVVEVMGPNVFSGYWRMPEKTAEEFCADGFFITGDLGMLAADGRLTIVGRAKDLIISGGYNIYPKEIERCIDELDVVCESAVIGVPHLDFGEAVLAVVVVEPGTSVGEATINDALVQRLARFKLPRALRVVEELPRNAMGKVQKNVLRERYSQVFSSLS